VLFLYRLIVWQKGWMEAFLAVAKKIITAVMNLPSQSATPFFSSPNR
jgi:hypothetical protein